MKSLIIQEGYSIKNYQSFSLLSASYAAETASILIKALKYFITEQNWNHSLIRLAMQQFNQLSIEYSGVTGSLVINSDRDEINSTFVIYNVIPSDNGALQVQARAHIFHAKAAVYIQYIDVSGANSSDPTIVFADGTTNPPQSKPEQLLLTPLIGKLFIKCTVLYHHCIIISFTHRFRR